MPSPYHSLIQNNHDQLNLLQSQSDFNKYQPPQTYLGVVTNVDATTGRLSVWRLKPTADSNGYMNWNQTDPLNGLGSNQVVTVTPYNISNQTDEIKAYFFVGDIIQYFKYDGTGTDKNKMRGRYIARAKDYFWAQLNNTGSPTDGPVVGVQWYYNWIAFYWSGAAWFGTTFNGLKARNFNEINNGIWGTLGTTGTGIGVDTGGFFHNSNAVMQPIGNGMVQMYRFWNAGNKNWDYYFNGTPNSGQCPDGP